MKHFPTVCHAAAAATHLWAAGVQAPDDKGCHCQCELGGQCAVIAAEVQLGKRPCEVGQAPAVHAFEALILGVQVVQVPLQELAADGACTTRQQVDTGNSAQCTQRQCYRRYGLGMKPPGKRARQLLPSHPWSCMLLMQLYWLTDFVWGLVAKKDICSVTGFHV